MLCPCCGNTDFYIGFNDKDSECTTNPECKLFKKNKDKGEVKKNMIVNGVIDLNKDGSPFRNSIVENSKVGVITSGCYSVAVYPARGIDNGEMVVLNSDGKIVPNGNGRVYGESLVKRVHEMLEGGNVFFDKVRLTDTVQQDKIMVECAEKRISQKINIFKRAYLGEIRRCVKCGCVESYFLPLVQDGKCGPCYTEENAIKYQKNPLHLFKFVSALALKLSHKNNPDFVLRIDFTSSKSYIITECCYHARPTTDYNLIDINGEHIKINSYNVNESYPSTCYFTDLDKVYDVLTNKLKVNLEDYE